MKENRFKTVMKELFWGFGKPKTPLQKRMRIVNRALAGVALAYAALAYYPQALFAHSHTWENYTLHSHRPIPPEATRVLQRADDLLRQSELYSQRRHYDVLICDSEGLFNFFFGRRGGRAFAFTNPTRNIYIQRGAIEHDLSWKGYDTNIVRSLSSLIAHEVTHNFIYDRIGVVGDLRLPEWKKEGYCELISMHGRDEYERSLAKGMPPDVRPGYINPNYRRFLHRTLDVFGTNQPSFRALLKAPE